MPGTRSLRVGVWLAVAVTAVAIGWWAWSRGGLSHFGAVRPSSSTVGRDSDGTAVAARGATLSLRVNFARRAEVLTETPLIFDVTLSAKGDTPLRIGDVDKSWGSRLHFMRADATGTTALPWTPLLNTSPMQLALWAPSETGRAMATPVASPGQLRRGDIVRGTWTVAPEAVTVSTAGTYRVTASLDLPAGVSPAHVESAPVTVIVVPRGPEAPRGPREYARLKLSILYDLVTNHFDDAERAARELVADNPKSPDARAMLGDVLAAQGRLREAMETYRRALADAPASYEPPGAIYERMARYREGTSKR